MSKNEGGNDEKRGKMRKNTRKSGFLLKKLQKCLVGSSKCTTFATANKEQHFLN